MTSTPTTTAGDLKVSQRNQGNNHEAQAGRPHVTTTETQNVSRCGGHGNHPGDHLNDTPRPFLKWAGNKHKLLPQFAQYFPHPNVIRSYYEPFLGSGAVFLGFYAQWFHERFLDGDDARLVFLSDGNENLANLWGSVRAQSQDLISDITELYWGPYYRGVYNAYRDLFNSRDKKMDAELFVWLNRHDFNGLYRENQKGGFNVPCGSFKKRPQPPIAQIQAIAPLLEGVDISHQDYKWVELSASEGDFIYFDPPYYPVSKASFTSYDAKQFTIDDHQNLAAMFHWLGKKGVRCALSNSDCAAVRELYSVAGNTIIPIQRPGCINSDPKKRQAVQELLILNY